MNIAFIEPFYTGSHKQFADSLKQHSSHNIVLFTLPGRHWKWRMHGAAISLAEKVNNSSESFDLIVSTDMIDLSLFLSRVTATQTCQTVLYMHENQLTYPWSENDKDPQLRRDQHYCFVNYASMLCASHIVFNSTYHLESVFHALPAFLSQFPDYTNLHTVEEIKSKSSVIYLGVPLDDVQKSKHCKKVPRSILWNHRWEDDKNPGDFLKLLKLLVKTGHDFSLILTGETFSNMPQAYKIIHSLFRDKIIHSGYCETRDHYLSLLAQAEFLPVTSRQDFFGISIVEAAAHRVVPLLPKRLTYPELFPMEQFNSIFYQSLDQACTMLSSWFENAPDPDQTMHRACEFSWRSRVKHFDDFFRHMS